MAAYGVTGVCDRPFHSPGRLAQDFTVSSRIARFTLSFLTRVLTAARRRQE